MQMVAKQALILAAKEKVAKNPKSRLKTSNTRQHHYKGLALWQNIVVLWASLSARFVALAGKCRCIRYRRLECASDLMLSNRLTVVALASHTLAAMGERRIGR